MTPAEQLRETEALGESYLRLRDKLAPWGSFNTKHAGEDRFEKTEEALDELIRELRSTRVQWFLLAKD